MAVQFILGRSGTAKTTLCVSAAINQLLTGPSDQPLVLLVPEQSTYQLEQAVLADSRISGYNRLHILSFDRLSHLLITQSGLPVISSTGRQMIVHRVLTELKDKMKVYSNSAKWPGLASRIAAQFTEFRNYAKTPDSTLDFAEKLLQNSKTSTAYKFADLALVYSRFTEIIDQQYTDPEAQLLQTSEKISGSPLFKNAKVWIDGFSGFTGSELEIVKEILKTAQQTQIALCLDPENINWKTKAQIDPAGLFSTTENTYADLLETIAENRVEQQEPVILTSVRRFASADLAYIEKNIFQPDQPKNIPAENIQILETPDPRSEARAVAAEITRLVREKNYRYRDIAVIACDLSSYQHYINIAFTEANIPFFMDRKKSLAHHQLITLVDSALNAVIDDFSGSDIFTFLKTGLTDLPDEHIHLLENYCIAHGVTSSDWNAPKEWSFADKKNPLDENLINSIWPKAVKPLLNLKKSLKTSQNNTITGHQFHNAVHDLLDQLNITEKIESWMQTAAEKNDTETFEQHRQLLEKFYLLLDEFETVFEKVTMSPKDFASILIAAVPNITLALIPPRLDQVLIGSVERSRQPRLKAVFLLGTTQAQFPTVVKQSLLLTDTDRDIAAEMDFTLADSLNKNLAQRQYLAYIAFTRASEKLYITYPLADAAGSKIPASNFIDNIKELFTSILQASSDQNTEIVTPYDLQDYLCQLRGKDPADAEDLLPKIKENYPPIADLVTKAAAYDNKSSLENDQPGQSETRMSLSASRFNLYASCPYQYFARYILELNPREENRMRPMDIGSFYHEVLDKTFKQLSQLEHDFAELSNDQLLTILKKQIEQTLQTSTQISNFIRQSRHKLFMIETDVQHLEACLINLADMLRSSRFRPYRTESFFGKKDEGLGQITLDLPNGKTINLTGIIDRIDTCEIDGQEIAIVLDYKRRSRSFSWKDFHNGLDLQLPIYLYALKQSDMPIKTAGAFYVPVETASDSKAKGILNGDFAHLLETSLESGYSRFYNYQVTKEGHPYGNYKTMGALKPEHFEKLITLTQQKMTEIAQSIFDRKFPVSPYKSKGTTPCQFCDYRSLCRFDWHFNDYRHLTCPSKYEVLGISENGD